MNKTIKPIFLDTEETGDAFFICEDGNPKLRDLSPEEIQFALEEELRPLGEGSTEPALVALFEQCQRNKALSRFGK